MGGGGTQAMRVMFLVAMASGCTSRDAEVQPAPRPTCRWSTLGPA